MKARTYYILSLLIVFILMFSCLIVYNHNTRKRMLGSYVFSDVIPNMEKVSKISIKRGDREINLVLIDSLWRVKEADEYYANYVLLNGLFTDIYNSQYSSLVEDINNDLFSHPISLEFWDDKGKIIDNIVLGKKDEKLLYTFAKKDDETFLITGKFVLPLDILSWLQNPTFKYEDNSVLSFQMFTKTGNIIEFPITETPYTLRDYLSFLHFENALKDKNFDKTNVDDEAKFKIISEEGLVLDFTVLKKSEKYWGLLNISTTKLPTLEVDEYVRNNEVLYNGWYFELPQDYGKVIYNFLNKERLKNGI